MKGTLQNIPACVDHTGLGHRCPAQPTVLVRTSCQFAMRSNSALDIFRLLQLAHAVTLTDIMGARTIQVDSGICMQAELSEMDPDEPFLDSRSDSAGYV